jgi:hypothetical protein
MRGAVFLGNRKILCIAFPGIVLWLPRAAGLLE